MKRKASLPAKLQFPLVIETFKSFNHYDIRQLTEQWEQPSCWNGEVRVQKVRVTIEEIDEPKEVIAARLMKLWREVENMHHLGPIQAEAQRRGVELPHSELGRDRGR